ncbi:MDR family MFS transporter [Nakamurella lactea]|uniref:MDR family MFS transporter n=1 Tax=Nakamurella lactea TaxID=459515 RepID=UPI00040B9E7D|nr:MDR family MFS transporter [Nakamurella lactea]
MTVRIAKSPGHADDGSITHKQILTILSGLMAGMFLAALDQTVVSTAIRTIADDLSGQSLQAWVTTAYLITSTIATPLYGKLSDIYGRRPFYLLAISLFVIGSLACTFSTSMYELAAFRAFQGLGAGGLFSLSLAIMGDILAPRERAKYQGYFMAVFGTSSVLGPLIGGLFAGANSILGIAGWRWVFLINVPIGIAALLIVYRVLHIPHTPRDHRIDWWGAVALVVGLVPLLTVAEQGQQWGWSSAGSLILFAIGAIGLVSFVLVEIRMKEEALIPMRLFRNSGFTLMQVTGLLVGMAMFGAILTLPLFLQIVRGATPTQSGLQMLAMTIGMMSAAVISGQLTARTGRYKIFPQIGMALVVIGAVLLAFFLQIDTKNIWLWAMIFLVGFGIGNCMQSLTLATQNSVPSQDMGVATSAATFFRQVGGTIGVAVFLSMLFSLLPKNIGKQVAAAMPDPAFQQAAAEHAHSSDPAVIGQSIAHMGQQMEADTSFLQHIPAVLAYPFKQGFVDSMHPVFLLAAVVAALAFVVLLFFKEVPLRMTSALVERQQAAKAAAAADSAAGGPDEAAHGSHDAGDVPVPVGERIPGLTDGHGHAADGQPDAADGGGSAPPGPGRHSRPD